MKVVIFLVFGRLFKNNHDIAGTLSGLHQAKTQPRPCLDLVGTTPRLHSDFIGTWSGLTGTWPSHHRDLTGTPLGSSRDSPRPDWATTETSPRPGRDTAGPSQESSGHHSDFVETWSRLTGTCQGYNRDTAKTWSGLAKASLGPGWAIVGTSLRTGRDTTGTK